VVDANVLIAALLRDSTTRRLILLGGRELHAPRYLFEEVDAHWDGLCERSGLSPRVLRDALGIVRAYIVEHDLADYEDRLDEARKRLAGSDRANAPYVALSPSIAADGLWSNDRRLGSVEGIRVFRTADLLRLGPLHASREPL